MGNVVELRCFAGLTVAETARTLQLSTRTVDRLCSAARAWLYEELASEGS
jgi:DNA-directed RNA polymerase specialized sigma24 family protein